MPGLMTQATDVKKKEIPVSVEKFKGMQSNRPVQAVDLDAFSYLLNMNFVNDDAITSRKGSSLHMSNAVVGNKAIVFGTQFIRSGQITGKIIFITSDGNLYQRDQGTGSAPSLISSLTNTSPTLVGMQIYKNSLHIADGKDWFEWDGTTLTNRTGDLPTVDNRGDIVDVIATTSRLFIFTSTGWCFASVPGSIDMLTEANGAQTLDIGVNDGTKIMSAALWSNTIVVNKGNESTYQYSMHWIRGIGSTSDPFTVKHFLGDRKSPIAFIGRSAVQVGTDMIGLTPLGVTTLSAINNFQEANADPVSEDIFNYIKQITWSVPHKIQAVYDSETRQYLLAVPAFGASKCNLIFVYDTYKDRWALYNNWTVRCWIPNKDKMLYGNESGQMIQINSGESDLGSGYQKIADTGDNPFLYPDIIKYFKSVGLDIGHQGSYNLYVTPIVNGDATNSTAIPIMLKSGSSLWDKFIWDKDRWDGSGNTKASPYILARGKTLRLRFYNDQPNQPYTINSLTYRVYQKDSGAAKA